MHTRSLEDPRSNRFAAAREQYHSPPSPILASSTAAPGSPARQHSLHAEPQSSPIAPAAQHNGLVLHTSLPNLQLLARVQWEEDVGSLDDAARAQAVQARKAAAIATAAKHKKASTSDPSRGGGSSKGASTDVEVSLLSTTGPCALRSLP